MLDLIIGLSMFVVANAPSLVGFILPPFVDLINRDVKSDTERFIVVLIICILTAVILSWDELTFGSAFAVMTTASIIFFQSQVVFKLYFKNSFIRERLKPVEVQPEQEVLYDESI